MIIDVITAFPGIVTPPLNESIIKRAVKSGIVEIRIHDLRHWTNDKHQTIDDTPYGGGAGMVYKIEPLYECLKELTQASTDKARILLTSPRGKVLDQSLATQVSLDKHLIIISTRYKGVDERIKDFFPIEEISIGDYVITGGELAALVIIDSVVRLLPGAISDIDSAWTDSFSDGLLDCNYYTRPENFKDSSVPEILLSGDHNKINAWRNQEREAITKKNRPDLYENYIKEIKSKTGD
jgi:tRNA (guanine37-N1)-methyltransferase